MNNKEQLIKAKSISAPYITYLSMDCQASLGLLAETYADFPVYVFSVASGLKPCNESAQKGMADILSTDTPATDDYGRPIEGGASLSPIAMTSPLTCLQNFIPKSSDGSILIVNGASRIIGDGKVQQELADSRGVLTEGNKTIILLSSEGYELPSEMKNGEIIEIEEELPNEKERAGIITDLIAEQGDILPLEKNTLENAVKATRGLNSFAVNQATAFCLTKKGVNLPDLWSNWEKKINGVRGLTIEKTSMTVEDIAGLKNMKNHLNELNEGIEPPSAYIVVNEFDKIQAGKGDSNGTMEEINSYYLNAMTENGWGGHISFGVAGTAKSALASCIGKPKNIPTINLDMLALKGGIVGQTPEYCRKVFATIKAVCGSGAYFIATCNRVDMFTPEIKRRFIYGTYFYDLPTEEEIAGIVKIFQRKFPTVHGFIPDFYKMGCVGSDIKTCFEIAYRKNIPLDKAKLGITPVGRLSADVIGSMRDTAHNRFLSASYEGVYQKPVVESKMVSGGNGGRKIALS